MRRTLARTAAALTCLLVLGACTSEPSEVPPSATPSPTLSASATPAPTPAPSPTPSTAPTSGPDQDVTRPPTPPAALDGPATEDNAVLVGKYFMSLFPYMVATGDTTQWDALSGQNCKYCANGRAVVREMAASNRHGVGGALEMAFGSALDDGRGLYLVGVQYTEHPSQTVDADGAVVEEFPDTKVLQAHLEIRWEKGAWKVTAARVERLDAP